jgi:adenylylsulfate kinase-like enzyme
MSDKSRIVVLRGMGGQGKTQIAAKYIKDHQLEYQYAIWIDGTSMLTA